MIALYAYGRLFHRLFAYLKTCLVVNAERFAIPVVQAIDPEDFIWLLKEDGCAAARVSIVRFNHFNSDKPEQIVYIEASAFTDAKRRIVYISSSGIHMPKYTPAPERWAVEAEVRSFAKFLEERGISCSVTDEFGRALDPHGSY